MEAALATSNFNSIKTEYGTANAVSHMLRTPITCILGFNHLLNSTQLTDQQKEYTQNIEKSTLQLLSALDSVISVVENN